MGKVKEINQWPNPEPGYVEPKKKTQGKELIKLSENEKIVVLTVFRTGLIPFNKKEYNVDYVSAINNALKRNLTRPFEHWCITNKPEQVEKIGDVKVFSTSSPHLNSKYCKLELFRPDVHKKAQGKQIFTIDLDTVIIANIDDMFSYGGEFIMRRDRRYRWYGSSPLMSFKAGFGTHFYETFVEKPDLYKKHYPLYSGRGDQLFLYRHTKVAPQFWQEMFGEHKIMVWRDVIPGHKSFSKHTSIVFFCGMHTPPKHLNIPWVKKHWVP